MQEQFKRAPNNHLIKKTNYLQHFIIRKLKIRHLINSFDVSNIKGLTVVFSFFLYGFDPNNY